MDLLVIKLIADFLVLLHKFCSIFTVLRFLFDFCDFISEFTEIVINQIFEGCINLVKEYCIFLGFSG